MRYYVLRNGSNLYRFSSMITCAVKLKLRDNHDYKEAEMFEARLSFFIRQAEDMDEATGIEYLKLNSSQVNGVSDQHEKSKKPVLEM